MPIIVPYVITANYRNKRNKYIPARTSSPPYTICHKTTYTETTCQSHSSWCSSTQNLLHIYSHSTLNIWQMVINPHSSLDTWGGHPHFALCNVEYKVIETSPWRTHFIALKTCIRKYSSFHITNIGDNTRRKYQYIELTDHVSRVSNIWTNSLTPWFANTCINTENVKRSTYDTRKR